ncbi:MAG: LacI family transcriptional regulator [Flavobacterium sp.]|uniref:LacI family DNA-binding transcriptional regulator n=1 Tax=unclassified Flavobacterium TaxID=196869 RepID=UPI000C385FD3|nr:MULTISPECIES: LacI family DNA-binding transcriptional regulator [unclassified Flavobacterium]MBF04118.1 LacI family transcriptional regulator [Flavobacterium sp.]MCO6162122.1 LacI family transcriptional regulator [Flavobacterium sp. NRK F7]
MKAKATLKQIAKELGVSVSTVSKALSDSQEISQATKDKIKEFAALKNYKPNLMAKNLKYQKTNTIGVIIPNILNSFFAKVFSGIEDAARKRGYNIVTAISNESLEREKQLMEMLNNGAVDGFILSIAEETQMTKNFQHYNSIIKSGTPIVMFDRITDLVKSDKVIVDDLDSAFDATQHLINIGCKHIALLSTIDNLSVGKLRFEGYKKALELNKMVLDMDLILIGEEDEAFDLKIEKLLKAKKVDGIFAVDEHSATKAMKLALQKGYQIPKELNIIGFADGAWSRRLTPSLSTVSQHAPEIGEKSANLLIDRLLAKKEESLEYKTVVIKTELRQRDSTRKL